MEIMPPENLSKISVKVAYFSAFLPDEIVFPAVASRQECRIRIKIYN